MTTINAENAKQIRRSMDVLIQVTPQMGEPIVITNDNLISCIVSLRSDLSILEQTLPESEINIEAYFDEDISEILASIPDETPITYQAGYPGDMSPVRKFYLAEQITWADNVMSIHGVDAVHKLDAEVGTALYSIVSGPDTIANTAMGLIENQLGVTFDVRSPYLPSTAASTRFVVDDGATIRDFLARMHEYMHQEDDIWYTYVDAGIPAFSPEKPQDSWSINEEDCGEVERNIDRAIANINLQQMNIRQMYGPNAGTAIIVDGVGTSLSFSSSYVRAVAVGVGRNTRDSDLLGAKYSTVEYDFGVLPLVPVTDSGESSAVFELPRINHGRYQGLQRMLKDGIPQAVFKEIGISGVAKPKVFTQFIPWDVPYDPSDSYWTDNPGTMDIRSMSIARSVLVDAEIIESDTSDAEIAIGGSYYEMTPESVTYSSGSTGVDVDIDNPAWFGRLETEAYGENFPAGAFNSILSRSPVTGSFRWKGDPRMQPRDVFNFIGKSYELATGEGVLLTDEDGNILGGGSVTVCTIENITLTHEGGGTSAEITYREGIC